MVAHVEDYVEVFDPDCSLQFGVLCLHLMVKYICKACDYRILAEVDNEYIEVQIKGLWEEACESMAIKGFVGFLFTIFVSPGEGNH